jgi:hypothetical protein
MSAVDDVDELIEQYHLAIDEFLKGNPEPVGKLHSRGDDVTLANPMALLCVVWSRFLRLRSMLHRDAGMVRQSASRSYRSMLLLSLPMLCSWST